jgi:lipopolysaccharide transport system permease protein
MSQIDIPAKKLPLTQLPSPVAGSPRDGCTAPRRAEPPVKVIQPTQPWQVINFRELWQFRDLLYFLAWRDVKVRYKQTVLGVAWAVLQPLLMMVIFTLLFGQRGGVYSGDLPYPVFVFAGLLPWTFFSIAISNAGNSIVGSERLITKVYFPRLAVPFASVGAAVVDFVIGFGLFAVLAIILVACGYDISPGWSLLLAPVFFLVILLAALGMGTLLAALNVAYRDFRYVIPFLVQVWMLATPTIYLQPGAQPGRSLQILLVANPLASLIGAFRACVLGTPIPWGPVALATAIVAALFLTGCLYFRKVEDRFADII